MRQITPQEAIAKMQALCARSEQAAGDLRKKLYRYGFDQTVIEHIISTLRRQGFIDDLRYARAFCHDKQMFNRWGKLKIAHTLRGKGLNEDAIKTALAELDTSGESDTLQQLLRKKADTLRGKEPQLARASLMRFAASRGYSYEATMRALENLHLADGND